MNNTLMSRCCNVCLRLGDGELAIRGLSLWYCTTCGKTYPSDEHKRETDHSPKTQESGLKSEETVQDLCTICHKPLGQIRGASLSDDLVKRGPWHVDCGEKIYNISDTLQPQTDQNNEIVIEKPESWEDRFNQVAREVLDINEIDKVRIKSFIRAELKKQREEMIEAFNDLNIQDFLRETPSWISEMRGGLYGEEPCSLCGIKVNRVEALHKSLTRAIELIKQF